MIKAYLMNIQSLTQYKKPKNVIPWFSLCIPRIQSMAIGQNSLFTMAVSKNIQ